MTGDCRDFMPTVRAAPMKEALFYEMTDAGADCTLCPHLCRGIADGKTGRCRVRMNSGGKLVSLVYGEATSVAMDPIEKMQLSL